MFWPFSWIIMSQGTFSTVILERESLVLNSTFHSTQQWHQTGVFRRATAACRNVLGIQFPGSNPDLPSQTFVAVPGDAFNSSSRESNAWEPLFQDVWCLKTPKKHLQSDSDVNISKSLFSYLGFWELTVRTCALGWKSRRLCSFPFVVQASSRKLPASEISIWQTMGLQWRSRVGGLIRIAVLKDSFSDNSVRKVK